MDELCSRAQKPFGIVISTEIYTLETAAASESPADIDAVSRVAVEHAQNLVHRLERLHLAHTTNTPQAGSWFRSVTFVDVIKQLVAVFG